jgi:DNA-binding XRE family transcriptional regulator
MKPRLTADVVDLFWSWVDYGESDACWPWTGTKNSHGYGQFTIKGSKFGSHRIALLIATGDWTERSFVLHGCHFRACCNPLHLRIGTPLENSRDRMMREEHAPSRHGNALVKQMVALRTARFSTDKSQWDMARLIGVTQGTVSRVERGIIIPRPDKIAAFAAAYGVPVETFIPGAES